MATISSLLSTASTNTEPLFYIMYHGLVSCYRLGEPYDELPSRRRRKVSQEMKPRFSFDRASGNYRRYMEMDRTKVPLYRNENLHGIMRGTVK
jgi:hypothetical protein